MPSGLPPEGSCVLPLNVASPATAAPQAAPGDEVCEITPSYVVREWDATVIVPR